MSLLVDRSSRVLIQGVTGREGSFHTAQMRAFGTNVVAGVSPGKGGTDQDGVPIFDTVADAVAATGADVSGIFVPPAFAADAIMESAAAGVRLTVCITEGIPVLDMVRAREFVLRTGNHLLGANCPGIVTPEQCKVGIIPNHINAPGPVGIVGRSGTLTYEVIQGLSQSGMGQTTSVGIGGDPVMGLSFSDVLHLFADDPETRAAGPTRRPLLPGFTRLVSTSRWWRSSRGAPRLRASAWAMPARSSVVRPAVRRASSTHSPRPARTSPTPSRMSCA